MNYKMANSVPIIKSKRDSLSFLNLSQLTGESGLVVIQWVGNTCIHTVDAK